MLILFINMSLMNSLFSNHKLNIILKFIVFKNSDIKYIEMIKKYEKLEL